MRGQADLFLSAITQAYKATLKPEFAAYTRILGHILKHPATGERLDQPLHSRKRSHQSSGHSVLIAMSSG